MDTLTHDDMAAARAAGEPVQAAKPMPQHENLDQEVACAVDEVGTKVERIVQSLREQITANQVDRMERFLSVIAEGLSISRGARAAGVSRTTPYNWENDYPEFKVAWAEAKEEGLDLHEDRISAAGNYDFKASEIFLKARRKDVWGTKIDSTVNATVKLDAKIEGRVSVDTEWLESLLPSGQEASDTPALPE
jgi:hypothetical protein